MILLNPHLSQASCHYSQITLRFGIYSRSPFEGAPNATHAREHEVSCHISVCIHVVVVRQNVSGLSLMDVSSFSCLPQRPVSPSPSWPTSVPVVHVFICISSLHSSPSLLYKCVHPSLSSIIHLRAHTQSMLIPF